MRTSVVILVGLLQLLGCATGGGSGSGTGSSSEGGTIGHGGADGGGATTGGSSAGGGCPTGYEPSAGDCVDIDECTRGTDDCDPIVDCVNEAPGYHCEACPSGTTDVNDDGTQCDDIDECADETDDCDPLVDCFNDVPGFHCGPCPAGTIDTNGDGTLCSADYVIGLDDRHGYDGSSSLGTGSHHAQFRTTITGEGMTISVLNSLETSDLAGLHGLFVQQPYSGNGSPFSASEIAAIVAFVGGGGGLVIIGDGGSGGDQGNLNSLAQSWGVSYSSVSQWPNGLVISALVTHPVTTGVSSFGIDFGVPMTTVNAPAVALHTGSSVVLAAATGSGGSGNVVFLSDSCFSNSTTADYNINSLDNALLLTNILSFVTP